MIQDGLRLAQRVSVGLTVDAVADSTSSFRCVRDNASETPALALKWVISGIHAEMIRALMSSEKSGRTFADLKHVALGIVRVAHTEPRTFPLLGKHRSAKS